MKTRHFGMILLTLLLGVSICACDIEEGEGLTEDLNGAATVNITQVPSDVGCISISAWPGSGNTITQYYDVSPGQSSANLVMDELPTYNNVDFHFYGYAYDTPCSERRDFTYLSDWVTATVGVGIATNVHLVFRQVHDAEIDADFVKTVRKVVTGRQNTGVIYEDGTIQLWGYLNDFNPQAPQSLRNVKELALSDYHACALLENRTLHCWGYNYYGQVGNGTNDSWVYMPVQVLDNVNYIGRFSNFTTCAVSEYGPRCWGRNDHGMIGDGTTVDKNVPSYVSVSGFDISVSQGHTCAVQSNKSVFCWGENNYGQLGIGTSGTTDELYPQWVGGLAGPVQKIETSRSATCALLIDGTVQCWGANHDGIFGDGSFTNSVVPVPGPALTDLVDLELGAYHACALDASGSVWCWGFNRDGQLGNGTNESSNVPVHVLSGAQSISAAGYHACALMSDRNIKCWGDNRDGQLGNGTWENAFWPELMTEFGYETASVVVEECTAETAAETLTHAAQISVQNDACLLLDLPHWWNNHNLSVQATTGSDATPFSWQSDCSTDEGTGQLNPGVNQSVGVVNGDSSCNVLLSLGGNGNSTSTFSFYGM